jgi:hypothetical protein
MPAVPQKPFDLPASKLRGYASYAELARWLCEEVQGALDVRGQLEPRLDYWHRIYEQDRTRIYTNSPVNQGADLTSPLGTQYVDALHARTMQTVFGVEPIWTVEGWGDAVPRAPFVEEFHQWTAEDERVQSYVDRAILNSWIDGVGVLEVFEEIDYRPVRRTIQAVIEQAPDVLGQIHSVFGEDGRPVFVRDERGAYVEASGDTEGQPTGELEIDDYQLVRVGPGYAVIDLQDFLVLPGHARERRDVWGYAKRFFRRVPYLAQKAEDGIYDADIVTALGDDNERDTTVEDARIGVTVARQDGATAEKELWEVSFLANLDGAGERWWVATIHIKEQQLLRLKYDDLGTQIGFGRFVRFVPLPRKNSLDGFSVIGHKLITLIEEHTAVRNLRADKSALAANAPIKVMQGALYDPEEQPFGVGRVIYVRDMREVEQMVVADVPQSVNQWEQTIFDAAERSMGVNDVASGIQSDANRTLGEVQMRTGASEVRIGLLVKRLQESMEELGQIRHVIWKRALVSQGAIEASGTVMAGLEARGQDVSSLLSDGKVTPDLLEGKFKFKPRGSVDTADNGRNRADFVQLMQMLPAMFQANPTAAAAWQSPRAATALNEQVVKLFKFSDRQAILGMPGQAAGQTSQLLADPAMQAAMQAAMSGGAGASGGAPPMGGAAGGGVAPTGPPAPPMMGGGIA